MYVCIDVLLHLCIVCISGLTYIDINALVEAIISFCLALHVWFQVVAGARTYGTDSPAITSQPR